MLTAFLVILEFNSCQHRYEIARGETVPLRNPWHFPVFLSPQGRTCAIPTTSRASESQGILETPDGLYRRSHVPTTMRNVLSTHRRSAWWELNWMECQDANEGKPLPRNGKHTSLMDMRTREYRFIESVRGIVRRRDFLVQRKFPYPDESIHLKHSISQYPEARGLRETDATGSYQRQGGMKRLSQQRISNRRTTHRYR
jgi:hypothetical protein